MPTATNPPAVLDEELWRAWLHKGELRERATARKAKLTGAIAVLLLIGYAVFRLAL